MVTNQMKMLVGTFLLIEHFPVAGGALRFPVLQMEHFRKCLGCAGLMVMTVKIQQALQ